MSLKEDDFKRLGESLDIGDEIRNARVASGCTTLKEKGDVDGCGRVQSGCSTWCEKNCQYCEKWCEQNCETKESGCHDCQWSCESTCERNCQTSCEKGCQSSCERGCQSSCEKSSQCGRCEDSYQCGSCESCQTSCEKNYQCGSCENCQSTCEKGCQSSCQTGCESAAQKNTAPTTPSSISVPTTIKGGDTIIVQWGSSTDSNLAGYILEKKTDNGSFTQIYKGSSRSFSDTIAAGVNKVIYRVKAYDTYGANSSYKTSNEINVTNNTAPKISGKDEDLGGKKAPFKVDISVSDKDMGDSIDLIAKLNGSTIKSIRNAAQNTNYEINIDSTTFNALKLNARNEIEISVTDGKSTAYRRYYFTRINAAPTIELPTTNFGTKNQPFSFNYTVKDAENDTTNVRILYGEKVLESIKNVSLNSQKTFKFSKLDFAQIPAGDITIKIEATDDKGGTASKAITFKKEINGCGYIFKKETSAKATQIIVTVGANVDEKSTLKVSVCNNAKDSSPSWEVVTDSLDKIYNFKNSSKTASSWCVGVKAEIIRGKDAGDSYLDAIGINYR